MCKATMYDVCGRKLNKDSYYRTPLFNVPALYKRVMAENYSKNLVATVIKEWGHLSTDTNSSFVLVMELFDRISKDAPISDIKYFSNIIESQIIPKVRDASATHTLIKRKLGRAKTKIVTKINNNIEDMKNAATDAADSIKNNVATNVDAIIQNTNAKNSEAKKKENTVTECLESMLYKADVMCQCDRVLNNHEKISKRYNINSIIQESVFNKSDIYDTVIELCSFIDTYTMEDKVKYNVALENIMYAMHKSTSLQYQLSDIVEAVTDYFLVTRENCDVTIKDMVDILKRNKFFKDEDIDSSLSLLTSKPSIVDIDSADPIISINSIVESSNENPVKKLVDDFKTGSNKTAEKLNQLVNKIFTKIYAKDESNIVDEVPSIFSLIRVFIVLGSFAITPLIGIVSLITDRVLGLTFTRKNVARIIKDYKSEIEKSEKRLNKDISDETKSNLNKYISTLKNNLKKLEDYESNLYTDDENIDRMSSSSSSNDFDLSAFGLDDDFFKNESTNNPITSIMALSEAVDTVKEWNGDSIIGCIADNVDKMGDVIDFFTSTSMQFPDIIDPYKLKSAFDDAKAELKDDSSDNISKYILVDTLRNSIAKLESYSPMDKAINPGDALRDIVIKQEVMSTVQEVVRTYAYQNSITEMTVGSNLKLAMERIKKGFVKLSDKDKQVSRQVDASVNTLVKSAERAVSNGNREAIIKGSIIPSASKVIKTAIVTGAAFLVQPVVAVIGLLGSIAISKGLQAKERQLILDDIEIELKMVDRYIRMAEDKNDMKALKNLLTTQRSLERQRQRIKYKMKVDYNQNVPSVDKTDDEY